MNKSISCGGYHSVALRDDGTVKCWGNNTQNQCNSIYKTFTNIIKASCGNEYSVALTSDGTIKCWGSNEKNQLDPVYKTFTCLLNVI